MVVPRPKQTKPEQTGQALNIQNVTSRHVRVTIFAAEEQ
jgi:hypothetical protein